jgi:hypothetical protein
MLLALFTFYIWEHKRKEETKHISTRKAKDNCQIILWFSISTPTHMRKKATWDQPHVPSTPCNLLEWNMEFTIFFP